jgi:hypothetical protein
MGQRSAAELIIFTISGFVNAARPIIVPYKNHMLVSNITVIVRLKSNPVAGIPVNVPRIKF